MSNRREEIMLSLLAMVKKDLTLQKDLSQTVNLQEGYHPDLEKVHVENGYRLREIIKEIGWPTVKKVGEEASYAAWVILQNAISCPILQKECIPLLMDLANNNEIYPSEVAVLYDRICYFEMRPQKYGTQFDFDENDELSPWIIEEPDKVDGYRKQVGLPPLADSIKRMREIARKYNDVPTKPFKVRNKERKAWAIRVGWIKA